MPYNSETGAYERRSATVIDATPDGDTVAVAIDTKLDTAADDAVLDLNHHRVNGRHYPAIGVATNSRYLRQSPAGVVAWANGVPIHDGVESALLAASGGSALVGHNGGTVKSRLDADAVDLAARPTSATLAASGGSALVGFMQAGTGASARTVQAKLRDVVSVKDFGAVGDGTTDDTAAIERADAVLVLGGEILFGRGETYLCESTVNIVNAGSLNLNGSTIKASSAITSELVLWQRLLNSYSAPSDFTAFSVTQNASSFTIPAGVSLSVGDVVKLRSNTDRITQYKHGALVTILGVSGGVAYVNIPFYGGFQVDEIRRFKGFAKMELSNGFIDMTLVGSAPAFTVGVRVLGSNIFVHGCTFTGSLYAGMGLMVEGDGALIENCKAVGFRNTQGLPGGGRIGYGIGCYGNNTIVHGCTLINNKHGIASGSRELVSMNVIYKNCFVYEDASATASDYTGSLDMHYNCSGVLLIEDCHVIGHSRLLSLRAPGIVVRGGDYAQSVGDAFLVEGFEAPYSNLRIEGIKFFIAKPQFALLGISGSTADPVNAIENVSIINCTARADSLGSMVETTRATPVTNLTIEGNRFNGGKIFRTAGGSISGTTIRQNVMTVTADAVRIVLDGGVSSIADLEISENQINRLVPSNEHLLLLNASTSTRIPVQRLKIKGNTANHQSDTGNGYCLSLSKLDIVNFLLTRNVFSRGSFRCVSMDGCSVTNGLIDGQIIDGTFFIQNNSAATVLSTVSVLDNVGDTYSVLTTGSGITKTRYVTADNNFATFTP
jgi:hypothetical protein